MTSALKTKWSGGASEPGKKEKGQAVELNVTSREDVAPGMVEVTVFVADQKRGSSLVLTSPRSFAFRKEPAS